MDDVLVDVFGYDLSEEELLLWFRCIVVGLGCEVVRVLGGHKMQVVLLDVVDDLRALDAVAVLEEGLENAAAVVLIDQLVVLGADQVEALSHDSVLLLVGDLAFSLLDEELIVVDPESLDEVRHLLLLSAVHLRQSCAIIVALLVVVNLLVFLGLLCSHDLEALICASLFLDGVALNIGLDLGLLEALLVSLLESRLASIITELLTAAKLLLVVASELLLIVTTEFLITAKLPLCIAASELLLIASEFALLITSC